MSRGVSRARRYRAPAVERGNPPRAEGAIPAAPWPMLCAVHRPEARMKLFRFVVRQLAIVTIVTVLVIATGHLVSYLFG